MNKLFKICCITDCRAHEIEKENKAIRFSSSRSRIVDQQNRSLERRVKSSLPVKIRATNPFDIAQVTHAGQIYMLNLLTQYFASRSNNKILKYTALNSSGKENVSI